MGLSKAALGLLVVGLLGAGVVGKKAVRKLQRWQHRSAVAAAAQEAKRSAPAWTPPAFTVPAARPRLWWTPERLARAKAFVQRTKFAARDDDPTGQAILYLTTGDKSEGRRAVDWLMKLEVSTSGVASDGARWFGEDAMLVFDWCHDLLTPQQLQTLTDRWNVTLDTLNKKSWGNGEMPANNYFWGYTRNDLEWGLATAHDNPRAAGILDEGLRNRFGRDFVAYGAREGRGGVLTEGTQYGQYILGYATVPLVSMSHLGVNMWDATTFFRDAVYYLIYATTPGWTATAGGNDHAFELFPFNDDEKFRDGGSAQGGFLGRFMVAAAKHWHDQPVGQYAQAWVDLAHPKISTMVADLAEVADVKPRKLDDLPLDYYAPGAGFFYGRNRWGDAASVFNVQMGIPDATGHQHVDWGSFQLWRQGRWLTRETVGYQEPIAAWGGGPPGEAGSDGAVGHNTVLFEGIGARSPWHRRGKPHVVRMESRPEYAYAAVDLTDSYRCDPDDCRPERDDNPYAASLVRELIYLRGLETLVVFDRAGAAGDRKPAADVVRTFLLHAETKPAPDGPNRLLIKNGNQALRVATLLPRSETPRIVTEGGKIGQFRVEIDDKGADLGYFLNVLQARTDGEPAPKVTLQEGAGDLTVRVEDPARGNATVVLQKGAQSRGGRVTTGGAALPLRADVQGIQVTAQGPRWQ
ncbi:MAG TPA: hypothetical protein VN962_27165 [Polyangia bacterium]|nr:hypothetical protein [Polyangia bacterium]